MGNFQGGGNRGGGFRRGNRGGGRSDFRGGHGGKRDDRREVTMHKTICSKCNKPCEVPFNPSGDKPVYCNDCFINKRDDINRGGQRDFRDRGSKREFNSGSNQPSFSKPSTNISGDDVSKKLGEINNKLDRLLSLWEKSIEQKEKKEISNLDEVIKKAVTTKTSSKKVAQKSTTKKKK